MSDMIGSGANNEARKPQWRTPVLSVDSISDSTRHIFLAGIDNYEVDNPVNYGTS